MSRFLITQSLLSAFKYLKEAEDEETALEDFLHTLRREQSEPNEFMQNGIDFEAECYSAADGKQVASEGAKQIGQIIAGAARQVKVSKNITVNGTDYLVYGILDALKAGTIFDIKFSNKPLGSVSELGGRYFHSPQHPTYFFLVPEAYQFKYLVSDGFDLYEERYLPGQFFPVEILINELATYLKTAGFWDLYCQKWECRDD